MSSSLIKGLVSKKRRRFKQDGFDLDLTYILPNVIAMGYPGDKLEGIYRNNIEDVNKFLESKHHGHYKIYNLCEERTYNVSKFKSGTVAHYPFVDHNPPEFSVIPDFCKDVHKFLQADKDNVAVVHCKAGKGRTGVMICSYLLHSGQCKSALDALNYYAKERTQDEKGVTIPSQIRYVSYYEQLLKRKKPLRKKILYLTEINLNGSITDNYHVSSVTGNNQSITLQICVTNNGEVFNSNSFEWRNLNEKLNIKLEEHLRIYGDVKIEIYNKPIKVFNKKSKLFQTCFNTFFILEDAEAIETINQTVFVRLTKSMIFTSNSNTVNQNPGCSSSSSNSRTCPPLNDTHRPKLPDLWTHHVQNQFSSELPTTTQRSGSTPSATVPYECQKYSVKYDKPELDKAHKDIKSHKIFSSDFNMRILFNHLPQDSFNETEFNHFSNKSFNFQCSNNSSSDTESDSNSEDSDNELNHFQSCNHFVL